jgi:carbamoyltransferase
VADLILGVHAGINAAAAIGDASGIRYCVQEERLAGEKGYTGFPCQAVTACLKELGAAPADVATVACGSRSGHVDYCSRDDLTRRLRAFHRQSHIAGRLFGEWRMAGQRPDGMRRRLAAHLAHAGLGDIPLACYDHHTAHGAAAYYGLREDPATPYLVLTCDGFGDGACATVAVWQDGKRRELARTDMRNSLGLIYRSAVKKSSARIPCAWDRRNSAQPGPSRRGAGLMPASLRICQTVDGATVMPSPASSP